MTTLTGSQALKLATPRGKCRTSLSFADIHAIVAERHLPEIGEVERLEIDRGDLSKFSAVAFRVHSLDAAGSGFGERVRSWCATHATSLHG